MTNDHEHRRGALEVQTGRGPDDRPAEASAREPGKPAAEEVHLPARPGGHRWAGRARPAADGGPAAGAAPFSGLVTAVRWAALSVGLILAALTRPGYRHAVAAVVLLAYALWRTVRPLTLTGGQRWAVWGILGELVVAVAVVATTSGWRSPFVSSLVTPIVAAGFLKGFFFSVKVALAAVVGVALPFHLDSGFGPDARFTTAEWGAEMLLIGLLASYARRLTVEAEGRASAAIGRLTRLAEANQLLLQLNRVAQALPASLDLSETVSSTVARLRELFSPDAVALLLLDGPSASWTVAAAEGVTLANLVPESELPAPLARVTKATRTRLVADAALTGQPGLAPGSRSGLYAPLWARERLVGVVAVERRDAAGFDAQHARLMDGLAEQLALALDNARWFGRLRRVGADEERTRIARDIHDRVGSSLAFLAFELDRIATRSKTEPVEGELDRLRQESRSIVTEMREALYDLRADVTEDQDLVATLGAFLQRVDRRSAAEVVFRHRASSRLGLLQERELWRIAQEAVTNAERHAQARTITVDWACDGQRAVLEVFDDGVGISRRSGRVDSYGILGMRERADAIGASLEVRSGPGSGTLVCCRLEAS